MLQVLWGAISRDQQGMSLKHMAVGTKAVVLKLHTQRNQFAAGQACKTCWSDSQVHAQRTTLHNTVVHHRLLRCILAHLRIPHFHHTILAARDVAVRAIGQREVLNVGDDVLVCRLITHATVICKRRRGVTCR